MSEDVGEFDAGGLSLTEQDAFSLSRSAVMLDQSKEDSSKEKLAAALDHNLEIWVGIRTLVGRPEADVPQEVQDNLTKLANYVADTTMAQGVDMSGEALDSLININLQISEGLLEGNQ